MTLRALRIHLERNPLFTDKYEIHYLTKAKFAPLLKICPMIHTVHTISNRANIFDLKSSLDSIDRNHKFEVVFDLHRNLRSTFVYAYYLFFKKTPVFRLRKPRLLEWLLFIFKDNLYRNSIGNIAPTLNRVMRYTQVLSRYGKNTEHQSFENIKPSKNILLPESKENLVFDNYICICVESAWKEKQWDRENFKTVARECRKRFGVKIVWLGLESLRNKNIETNSSDIDLTGKIDLLDVAAVLKNSKMLVCNDSGLMHLAESVGVPVIAIFGPTTPQLGFAPSLSESQVVESHLWCRPCSKTGRSCFRIKQPRKCLALVEPEEVLKKISMRFGVESKK